MEIVDKIVEFENYCKTCLYQDLAESEEPCNECLTETTNVYSHKPVKYKENK